MKLCLLVGTTAAALVMLVAGSAQAASCCIRPSHFNVAFDDPGFGKLYVRVELAGAEHTAPDIGRPDRPCLSDAVVGLSVGGNGVVGDLAAKQSFPTPSCGQNSFVTSIEITNAWAGLAGKTVYVQLQFAYNARAPGGGYLSTYTYWVTEAKTLQLPVSTRSKPGVQPQPQQPGGQQPTTGRVPGSQEVTFKGEATIVRADGTQASTRETAAITTGDTIAVGPQPLRIGFADGTVLVLDKGTVLKATGYNKSSGRRKFELTRGHVLVLHQRNGGGRGNHEEEFTTPVARLYSTSGTWQCAYSIQIGKSGATRLRSYACPKYNYLVGANRLVPNDEVYGGSVEGPYEEVIVTRDKAVKNPRKFTPPKNPFWEKLASGV